jgi:hypothetical protein
MNMPAIYLSDATGEHNRFNPFPAFTARQAQSERPGEALDDRFTEFIAVIRRTVACFDLNL